ncbi:hypothetical protein [Actomonas aquatica]|uniref:Porin domain-containing protein n=1 Tax=Actomonas aquatica TaxID=2866162 RepID=A0ABZ1C6P5_9BACT|nr:hypothetical protein [Opitutus sp. WL0086]WRQ86933.1 hypothetical protein K1X11_019135 [Opitutus sp. WL0086]
MRPLTSSLLRPVALLALGLLSLTSTSASTAYIPAPGTSYLHPNVSVQWATDFWFDDNLATLPGHLTQTTASVEFEYGLAPDFALDATAGYSTVNYQGGPLGGLVLTTDGQEVRDGLTDIRLGASWRILDEFRSLNEAAPTITLRAGAILAGTYDTGFLNAVSDGADGFELGVKFGKQLLAANAGLYGDFTYRFVSTSTPDEWEASIGAYKTIDAFTLSLGLREKQSVGGIDILGPGFTLARFTDVREKNRTVELGLTYAWRPTATLSLGYARTLEGENTPKKNVLIAAASFRF